KVVVSIPAGAAQDDAGNSNFASTSTDNTVTFIGKIRLTAVGVGSGTTPQVKVYNPDGTLRFSFLAYDSAFTGGVTVATGDVTGDGKAEVITGAGFGGGPHIRVFDLERNVVVYDFFAYDNAFRGGAYVAAGDLDGDGRAEIITGAGEGGGPHVKIFSGANGSVLQSFFAYDPNFRGGVRVGVGDLDHPNELDVITGAGPGGTPHV